MFPGHGWCGHGGPSTISGTTACALASRGCALRGWREGVPGGGLPFAIVRGPALSLWLACPAWGYVPREWWEVVPGGWPTTVERGVLSRLRPSPGRPSLGAGSQDPLPLCPGHRWCVHGGPNISPTACTLASQHCAL